MQNVLGEGHHLPASLVLQGARFATRILVVELGGGCPTPGSYPRNDNLFIYFNTRLSATSGDGNALTTFPEPPSGFAYLTPVIPSPLESFSRHSQFHGSTLSVYLPGFPRSFPWCLNLCTSGSFPLLMELRKAREGLERREALG